jgi:hypothetical protein
LDCPFPRRVFPAATRPRASRPLPPFGDGAEPVALPLTTFVSTPTAHHRRKVCLGDRKKDALSLLVTEWFNDAQRPHRPKSRLRDYCRNQARLTPIGQSSCVPYLGGGTMKGSIGFHVRQGIRWTTTLQSSSLDDDKGVPTTCRRELPCDEQSGWLLTAALTQSACTPNKHQI